MDGLYVALLFRGQQLEDGLFRRQGHPVWRGKGFVVKAGCCKDAAVAGLSEQIDVSDSTPRQGKDKRNWMRLELKWMSITHNGVIEERDAEEGGWWLYFGGRTPVSSLFAPHEQDAQRQYQITVLIHAKVNYSTVMHLYALLYVA